MKAYGLYIGLVTGGHTRTSLRIHSILTQPPSKILVPNCHPNPCPWPVRCGLHAHWVLRVGLGSGL